MNRIVKRLKKMAAMDALNFSGKLKHTDTYNEDERTVSEYVLTKAVFESVAGQDETAWDDFTTKVESMGYDKAAEIANMFGLNINSIKQDLAKEANKNVNANDILIDCFNDEDLYIHFLVDFN